MDSSHRVTPAERPKTLRKLKNVYENVTKEGNGGCATGNDEGTRCSLVSSTTDKSLSILSPFDEQEEWAKISEIMASFSSGLVRDSIFVAEMEKEIQSRLGTLLFFYLSPSHSLSLPHLSLSLSNSPGVLMNYNFFHK